MHAIIKVEKNKKYFHTTAIGDFNFKSTSEPYIVKKIKTRY